MKNGKTLRRVVAVIVVLAFAASLGAVALAQTVEGQGDYFVTGESYPTSIQMAGYNSRDGKLYLNFDLETTKTVGTTQTATFKYFVEVFDGNGAVLGTVGSYDVPETAAGIAGATTATVTNKEVGLSSFTAAYRTVITVKEVTIL
jgi:hypothetical protein